MNRLLLNEYNWAYPYLLEPNPEDVARLRVEVPSLFSSETFHGAGSVYDFNQLHLPNYLENWDRLDWQRQRLVQEFTRMSWQDCHFRRGIKPPINVAEHALLLIGGAIHDTEAVGRSGSRLVRSLFMDQGGRYVEKPCNLRQFSPRAARRFSRKLLLSRDFAGLAREFAALPVVIHAPRSIQLVGEDPFHAIEAYQKFFGDAGLMLERWSRRRGVRAVLGSSEISCSSISEGRFHPHVHALVWTSREDAEFIRDLPDDWTAAFKLPIQDSDHLAHHIQYLFHAYGLSTTYRRELERDNPDRQEFNRRTINAWSSLRRLRPSRGVRILNIPKRPAQ
jgi:hypothetical protein